MGKPSSVKAAYAYPISSGIGVNSAETLALWEGIQLVEDLGLHPLQVESDSKGVMNLLNGRRSSRTEVGLQISKILKHQFRPQILSFSFSPRVSNAAAHILSRLALSLEGKYVWRDDFPSSLCNVLMTDGLS
ncbi:hypothetical protein ACOSQ3_023570 [Xanthoceras sorbifolium]